METGGTGDLPSGVLRRSELGIELRLACSRLRAELNKDIARHLAEARFHRGAADSKKHSSRRHMSPTRMKEQGWNIDEKDSKFSGLEASGEKRYFPEAFANALTHPGELLVERQDSKNTEVARIPVTKAASVNSIPSRPEEDFLVLADDAVSLSGLPSPSSQMQKTQSHQMLAGLHLPNEAWHDEGGYVKKNEFPDRTKRRRNSTTMQDMLAANKSLASIRQSYASAAFLDEDGSELDDDAKQSKIRAIVVHDYFDYTMGLILIINAITIGVQVNFMAHHDSRDPPTIFVCLDVLFCAVFLVELVLRVTAFGIKHFLTMNGWQWNVFDVIIVGFGVLDESAKLALKGSDVQETIDNFGVLRMLRLGRVIRLVRMVRLIPALKSMVYLIAASMQSFFWTAVLLIIFMYCVAVYFTELCSELKHKHKATPDADDIDKHWGSIGKSVMSLFQAITGGDDWMNFVLPFKAHGEATYSLNVVIFSLYVAFAMLVMLNLVTGVFVEGAQKISRDEKEFDLVKNIRKLLAKIDTNGNGEVSCEEFEEHIQDPQMQEFLKGFDLDPNQARDIFMVLDKEGSGAVTMDEFISATISLRGPTKQADTATLRYFMIKNFAEMNRRLDAFDEVLLRAPRFSLVQPLMSVKSMTSADAETEV